MTDSMQFDAPILEASRAQVIQAVVFDLDGLLIDSERVWDEVREQLVAERGGRWTKGAQQDMMGMSSSEWSRYMVDELGLTEPAEEINAEVVRRMEARYREHLPLLPGAVEAVARIGEHWPLGLASSSNRPLIDGVLIAAGMSGSFAVTVSSEEVARGKPAPDVYLEAARLLEVDPAWSVAIEDSASGIQAAKSAGMRVIAIPNAHFPPNPDVLAKAATVLGSLDELLPEVVATR